MRTKRFWIETVALSAAVACALALLMATLAAAAVALAGRPAAGQAESTGQQTLEGMVTCSRCGAKHSPALGKTAGGCARICVHGGATFVLIDGDKTYLLDGDLNVLKNIAGQRSRVVGSVRGNTMKVASVTAAT